MNIFLSVLALVPMVILVQIIINPNKADHYKALFIKPFYNLFKWGSKKYIGSQVAYHVSEFFNRHIISNIHEKEIIKVGINWIQEPEDPILTEDTIIVCLKKTNDQTRNILRAAENIIPIVFHPHIRTNIDKHLSVSIDLMTLKKLADQLGKNGKYNYVKYFKDPNIQNDHRINNLLQKLTTIDQRGFFTTIFLNELDLLDKHIYTKSDSSDITNEVIEFIEYLIRLSRVEVGQEVSDWDYLSENFNLGIILLANEEKRAKLGTRPYLGRLYKLLKQGIENIYILAEPASWEFLNTLEGALKNNDRVVIMGSYSINDHTPQKIMRKPPTRILCLRRIDIVSDNLFKDKLESNNITKNMEVDGNVIEVNKDLAVVNIFGMDAFIRKEKASWNKIESCSDVFDVKETYRFIVEKINENNCTIELSRLFEEDHPWKICPQMPQVGDIFHVDILFKFGYCYICRDERNIDFILPLSEFFWHTPTDEEIEKFPRKKVDVKVINIDSSAREISVSVRQISNNPWQDIHSSYPAGTQILGTIKEIKPEHVKVEINSGVIGFIPRERLLEAGGLYTNHTKNLIVGQKLDVIISSVKITRQKILLKIKP